MSYCVVYEYVNVLDSNIITQYFKSQPFD